MADDFDDLKAAFDAATPEPDAVRTRAAIAVAEESFARRQGSRDRVRQTHQNGRMSRLLSGVSTL